MLKNIESDDDFREIMEHCDRLLADKGHDYTQGGHGEHGKLSNFYKVADRTGVTPVQVLYVYLGKHLDAIETHIRFGGLRSEPIESRIVDAINYLLLLAKLIAAEAPTPKHAPGGG